MIAGWLINIVIAEWVIRRQPVRQTHGPATFTDTVTGKAGRYAITETTQ